VIDLKNILQNIKTKSVSGADSIKISGLQFDSRKIEKKNLFIAISGTQVDGHEYISKAIDLGATCIVCERLPKSLKSNVCYVQVTNSAKSLGQLASNFHGQPSSKLKLIGITGTNGKTTVASLLFQLFREMGNGVGLISTVKYMINDTETVSTHTTPDALKINEMLAKMVDAGCTYCFMEVSSHAISQSRIEGLEFAGAAFTNITHDHLDYHKTFGQYINTKKELFDGLPATAFALYNKDDRNGSVMAQNCKASRYTYSINSLADFKGKIIEQDFNGMLLEIGGVEAWYTQSGKFNAYNLVTVYGIAFLLGIEVEEIITTLSKTQKVSGRFETLVSAQRIIGIIDYAHTPDALENVLKTINDIRSKNERLITVFGCGGDRDKTKRPEMASIACRLSDQVLITSDNPRNEDADDILSDIQKGVPAEHYKKVIKIKDREEAIKAAISFAQPGDIILVAGKGHENYQEIKGKRTPFSDKEILMKNLKLLKE
jgi:UDP-N-acetylmuramoyl-L-alanyl-D-glutamate--2,6-diaminopimelate ligase